MPKKAVRLKLPDMKILTEIGDAVRVEYRTAKGGVKKHVYTHKHGKGVKMFTNLAGDVIVITGPGLKVKEEGITG
jgi:signal peptidase I